MSNDRSEEREACVSEEELRAKRIELGIGNLLDCGEKDFGVVYSEMIALNEDGNAGKEKEREERAVNL